MQEIKKINLSLENVSIVPLKDVVKRVKVGFVGSCNNDYCSSDEGVPMIRTTNLTTEGIKLENLKYINNTFHIAHKKSQLHFGDILIARHGHNGLASLWEYKFDAQCLNVVVVEPDESLANRYYLTYLINSPLIQKQIKSLTGGSVQFVVNTKDIADLLIPIPSLDKQKEIADFISLFNKKISVCKSINKNLYNIIEARFKHYVKDFSNLDKVVLSDYCNDIIRGFNSKYVEKSNLINLNQKVNKGDILEKQYFKYLNDDIEVPKEKFAKRKDVLLNSLGDGTLGRVHYYNENTDNVIIDQHITIIRSDENKLPSSYIYQYLKCGAGQYHLNSLISGSTGMLMLNISHIRNLELPILPQKELFEFDNFAKDLFDKISSNTKEIEKLQKLRDTLLPKLMSGEIDVSKINCDLELKYNYMKYLFNQIHTPMSNSVV